jgi:hypothetical protein
MTTTVPLPGYTTASEGGSRSSPHPVFGRIPYWGLRARLLAWSTYLRDYLQNIQHWGMRLRIDFWKRVTQALEASSEYRLTEEEQAYISKVEQAAYEHNLSRIDAILQEYDKKLSEMGFWTERIVHNQGMRFRYSMTGYYSPGGYSSQFHITGPLVLGQINPKGDPIQSFYNNDLDKNVKVGADFDVDLFRSFIEQNILAFVAPENLITTREQYERIRTIYPHQS